MKFTILSHAGLEVESDGRSLVIDPWLVGSCYWRSWWNYPPPRELIRRLRPDFIYAGICTGTTFTACRSGGSIARRRCWCPARTSDGWSRTSRRRQTGFDELPVRAHARQRAGSGYGRGGVARRQRLQTDGRAASAGHAPSSAHRLCAQELFERIALPLVCVFRIPGPSDAPEPRGLPGGIPGVR